MLLALTLKLLFQASCRSLAAAEGSCIATLVALPWSLLFLLPPNTLYKHLKQAGSNLLPEAGLDPGLPACQIIVACCEWEGKEWVHNESIVVPQTFFLKAPSV